MECEADEMSCRFLGPGLELRNSHCSGDGYTEESRAVSIAVVLLTRLSSPAFSAPYM